jgi:uncharacterized protein YjiS (DUF1127 family)
MISIKHLFPKKAVLAEALSYTSTGNVGVNPQGGAGGVNPPRPDGDPNNASTGNVGVNPQGGAGGVNNNSRRPLGQPRLTYTGPPGPSQVNLDAARQAITQAKTPMERLQALANYNMQLRQYAYSIAGNQNDPFRSAHVNSLLKAEANRAMEQRDPFAFAITAQLGREMAFFSTREAWIDTYRRAYRNRAAQNTQHQRPGGGTGLSAEEQQRREVATAPHFAEYRAAVERYHKESLEAPREYQRRAAQERLDFLLENNRSARLVFMQERFESEFERREAELRKQLSKAYEEHMHARWQVAELEYDLGRQRRLAESSRRSSDAHEEDMRGSQEVDELYRERAPESIYHKRLRDAEANLIDLQRKFHQLQEERKKYQELHQKELERAGVTRKQVEEARKKMIDMGIIKKRERIELDPVDEMYSESALELKLT